MPVAENSRLYIDANTKDGYDGRNQLQTNNQICNFCGMQFTSRNAMFKHLRSSTDCHQQRANEGSGSVTLPPNYIDLPKRTVAIQFGYQHMLLESGETTQCSANEVAAEAVRSAFLASLQTLGGVEPQGTTYSSAARLRHVALAQEPLCAAASDVLVINFRASIIVAEDALRGRMQTYLENQIDRTGCSLDIRILGIENVPSSSNFHAEKDCTQRVYHYLLPLHWITDGDVAKEWLLERPHSAMSANEKLDTIGHQQCCSNNGTPVVLLKLKKALRLASSRTAWNRKERRRATFSADERNDENIPPLDIVTSPGRFGSLWRKERRCLHNFADPTLRGLASPNTETVWRSIDRASSIDVLATKNGEGGTNVTLVVELRGDSFLTEEVRRIIGSAVAVCNGWLPETFFETATRPDLIIETPLAPAGRMYLSGVRYHFQEESDGVNIFDGRGNVAMAWLDELQAQLLNQRHRDEVLTAEELWLSQVRDVQTPRIREQIKQLMGEDEQRENRDREKLSIISNPKQGEDISEKLTFTFEEAVPKLYQKTLSLLREVVRNGEWPITSEARARVIRPTPGLATSSSVNGNSTVGHFIQSGSFTVVNQEKFDGPVPLGNELFPELVKAIFELEKHLALLSPPVANGTFTRNNSIVQGIRPPSSHCAVNRNAEFTPHVDSGRGEGQSLSLIVGLGRFVGGSLVVEGKSYNVRYAPLEFDGWTQIHYTEPFQGNERFSLVWFTPETRSSSRLHVSAC